MKYFHRPKVATAQRTKAHDHDHQRQFHPNTLANAPASDRRRRRKEGAQEKKRGIKQSEIQFQKCRQTPPPAGRSRVGERPEFAVTFRREIGMMCLMNGAIKTEAHQADHADDEPVELVEAAIFSEKPVSRFVQADESAVHQMADHQHERHGQPDQIVGTR